MTLHHVAVEAAVEAGAAFEVHLVARLQQPEVGLVEGFADGGDGIGVTLLLHHSEAYAVMRDALVDLQLIGE